MALKLVIDKLDEVDEVLRSLYAEKDGKFALQVDGLEDTTGLRSALGKERHARAELEKKIKKWEAIGKSDEEIADLIAKHEESLTTEAERKGEWDKLKAQMVERQAAELKKLQDVIATKDKEIGAVNGELENQLIKSNVTAAIAAAKGDPELLEPHVLKRVRIEKENGSTHIVVVDDKGDKRFNVKGEPLPITEMVMEMRASDKYGRLFDGTGASGSGMSPTNGGGNPHGIKRRSEFKTEKERAAFVTANGIAAYEALPS